MEINEKPIKQNNALESSIKRKSSQIFRKRKLDPGISQSTSNNPVCSKRIASSDEGRLAIYKFIDESQLEELKEKDNQQHVKELPNILKVKTSNIINSPIYTKSFTKSLEKSNKKKISRIPDRSLNPIIPEGNFYGLSKKHKQFLFNLRGISKLYDWQEQCLNLDAIHNRSNFIYSTPTSGGKTLVSEILMLREVLLRKQNVIFILPYVSIVREKVQDMMPLAVEFNFLIEEYCAGKGSIPPVKRRKTNSIFICTIEKGHILVDSLLEAGRIKEVSLIVVDELHMLGDSHRGHILESLLTKIIYLEHVPIQIVGMSATIENLNEISTFLLAESFTHHYRPVELKEYVKTGNELYRIQYNTPELLKNTNKVVGKSYTQQMLQRDPDHIGYFVYNPAMESSCLVFCPTKANCENVAMLIAESLPKELMKRRTEEKNNLISAIKGDLNGSICTILRKSIPFGVAYHHSGLTNDERKHIEEAFHLGILTVICCTSTLAAGVNLPASRVIIRSPYVGLDFFSLIRYKQMIGRAGRTGKAEKGDSILICDKKDFQKVTKVLTSKMDEVVSGYIKDDSHIKSLILNLIGTGLCRNFNELHDYSKCMLSRVQQGKFAKNIKTIFVDSLKELMDEALVVQKFQSKSSHQSALFRYQLNDTATLVYAEDFLTINKLARAAVSSGISLNGAIKLEIDLQKAHESLVLSQCLHLLYVVAPKEAIGSITLNYKVYSDIILKLDSSLLGTAKIIGINEKTAMKMIRNQKFQETDVYVLKRFYIALVLYELWNGKDVFIVSKHFHVTRGIVHKLMYSASMQAYSIFKFCEVYEEFWVFKEIMEQFSKRLAYCCSTELLPLMELPAVKIARAKMMYTAGIRTVADVAVLSSDDLIKAIKNINKKQAEQIIRAAKNTFAEQIDTLKAQMYEIQKVIKKKGKK